MTRWVPIVELQEQYKYRTLNSVYCAVTRENIPYRGQERGWKYAEVDADRFELFQIGKNANGYQNPNVPLYNKFWKLNWDLFVTSADWHVSKFDWEFANHMREICRLWGVKKHMIAGDFFDEDEFKYFINTEEAKWVKEKRDGRGVGDVLFEDFDVVKFLMGNHDIRIIMRLLGKGDLYGIWEEVFLRSDIRQIVSEYGYCTIKSGKRRWVIGHPEKTSIIPGRYPTWLAHKYPGHSILTTHSHQTAVVFEESGTQFCIEIGGMTKQEAHAYKMKKLSRRANWVKAFCVIQDGYPYVFTEFADWEYWRWLLKKGRPKPPKGPEDKPGQKKDIAEAGEGK